MNLSASGAKCLRIVGWYVLGWKKFAQFRGRSSRREYWTFILGNFLILVCVAAATPTVEAFRYSGGLCLLVSLVASLAIGVRRLHDLNKGGGWLLLAVIPYLGGIALLVILLLKGDPETNEYGSDPRIAVLPHATSE
jgi:uncharacterized membrane protein YhaH (DUF805 family)